MSYKFFETLQTLERLDGLIRRKGTGKPLALAQRLGISERQVYNLISALRELGAPVAYCNKQETYYYTQEVEFRRELFVLKDDADKIKGGETFWGKIETLQDFCSAGKYF